MPCRLYLDEDSSDTDLVFALRSRHVDVVTALEAGLKEVPDEVQLTWAAEHERVEFLSN